MADQEDEDLKLAIALSLQEREGHSGLLDTQSNVMDGRSATTDQLLEKSAENHQTLAGPISGLLGLDRAAMERERLERKRKAAGLSQSSSPPPDTKKARVDVPSAPVSFPDGAVRKTWVKGFAREDDIKIEEVLQRDDLQLAVLSSFQWDIEWLLQKIDLKKSKVILVMEAKDEATKAQYRKETAGVQNLRLCFPPMLGVASHMHSKLMLLSHPTYLRIAVPSANLVRYDWGETGHMENSLFVLDLPRLANSRRTEPQDLPPFGQDLTYFCKAIGLPDEVVKSMLSFDFSKTKDYAFVHSIGGPHEGAEESWRRTGYCGLGRAVSQLGLSHQACPLRIDFVASSIGSLNSDFLSALYLAAQGDDGTAELVKRTPSAAKHLSRARKLPASKEAITNRFTIYFPSNETVDNSRGGPMGAGTVCFQESWFSSARFPQRRLRDCLSTREGLLMHNKVSSVSTHWLAAIMV